MWHVTSGEQLHGFIEVVEQIKRPDDSIGCYAKLINNNLLNPVWRSREVKTNRVAAELFPKISVL